MPIDREAALKKAEKLLRQGKLDGAIEEYVRLIDDQPRDWAAINALGDLYLRAGDSGKAVEQFTRVADHLFRDGFFPRAAALYKKALKVQPRHEHTLSQLAEIASRQGMLVDGRTYLRQLEEVRRERGDAAGVAECGERLAVLEEIEAATTALTRPVAPAPPLTAPPPAPPPEPAAPPVEDDAAALFARAQRELAAGDERQARATLTRVLTLDPDRHHEVLRLALDLARGGRIESAEGCIDVVADAAILGGDWERALGALQRFVAIVPRIPVLNRLVEVCVDARVDEPLRAAQALLADAHLDAGDGDEARVIALDLLEADPGNAAHVARLRRALQLLGAPAPEWPELVGDAALSDLIEVDLSDALASTTRTPEPDGDAEVAGLVAATRDPHTRVRAAGELGRIYLLRGDMQKGIEWLRHAADGTAATPDEGFAVLYDLADALERSGEPARALAIFMDLDAESGGYRDVRERIERLAHSQTESESPRR